MNSSPAMQGLGLWGSFELQTRLRIRRTAQTLIRLFSLTASLTLMNKVNGCEKKFYNRSLWSLEGFSKLN